MPAAPLEHRKKLRVGFALCSAALALVLVSKFGMLLPASFSPEWSKAHERDVPLLVETAIAARDSIDLGTVLAMTSLVLLLFPVGRTAICCGRLALACSASGDQRPPDQTA